MGNQRSVTNCQSCIDCLQMIDYTDIHNPKPTIVASRCYGDEGYGELKRNICEGLPPKKSPEWCPNRKAKVK
ncbi:hypothetical protein LCGC14_0488640 [marine sediment metagenome]|uniref:Uncharacterized protein n=1 Tax=marine sediment metagenome TaxID=412755 RepID=A0A0F9SQG3_9ZZZZ